MPYRRLRRGVRTARQSSKVTEIDLLHGALSLMIKKLGKRIGKHKVNLGELSPKLTWCGKSTLLNVEAPRLILSKISIRLRTLSSVVLMSSGCWRHMRTDVAQ